MFVVKLLRGDDFFLCLFEGGGVFIIDLYVLNYSEEFKKVRFDLDEES